jgi:hypothetical protein
LACPALAEQLKWDMIRADGLAAMDELYQQIGYPTPEQVAAADAAVDEELRLHREALEADARDAAEPGPRRASSAVTRTISGGC